MTLPPSFVEPPAVMVSRVGLTDEQRKEGWEYAGCYNDGEEIFVKWPPVGAKFYCTGVMFPYVQDAARAGGYDLVQIATSHYRDKDDELVEVKAVMLERIEG